MKYMRVFCAMAPLCGFLLMPVPVRAQAEQETIPLIMLKPQGAGFGAADLRKLYAALKKRSANRRSTRRCMTKSAVGIAMDAARRLKRRMLKIMNIPMVRKPI